MKQVEHLAQNKIDYIVFHNTKKVSELLYNQGFEPPEDPVYLAEAIKELIRKKGRKFLEELVELHPDKKMILSISKSKTTSSCSACKKDNYNSDANYCANCGHSNYMALGDEDSFLSQFDSYKDGALEKYYLDTVRKSNESPENKDLAKEVQVIWNEIRQRKEKQKKELETTQKQKNRWMTKDDLILIGIVFFAGALVGHGLKFNLNNGK